MRRVAKALPMIFNVVSDRGNVYSRRSLALKRDTVRSESVLNGV